VIDARRPIRAHCAVWECMISKAHVRYRKPRILSAVAARASRVEAALRHVKLIAAGAPGRRTFSASNAVSIARLDSKNRCPDRTGEEHKPACEVGRSLDGYNLEPRKPPAKRRVHREAVTPETSVSEQRQSRSQGRPGSFRHAG